MPKNILLISYTFPPSASVGARRWAKFAKYLKLFGNNVYIFTATPENGQNTHWNKDINNLRDNIYRVHDIRTKFIKDNPKSLIDKLLYRLTYFYVSIFHKGSYFDKSIFWKKKINKKLIKIIDSKNIDVVIASGAPFHYLKEVIKLKSNYKKTQFIADIRDPWDVNTPIYGFHLLSDKKRIEEDYLSKITLENYDKIITVATDISENIKNKCENRNVFTLTNGFDKDDYKDIVTEKESNINEDKVVFTYAGSIYPQTFHLFEELCDVLDIFRKEYPDIYSCIEFNFYGNIDEKFQILFLRHPNNLKHWGFVDLEIALKAVLESDFCTLFLIDELNYSFSTKFFEYLALGKPILVFSKDGATGRYIESNNLGYFAKKGFFLETMMKIYNDKKSKSIKEPTIDKTKFEIKNLTKKLIEIIDI